MDARTIKVIVDPKNPEAVAYTTRLKEEFKKMGVQLTRRDDEAKLFVVLGGDGTMLSAKEGRCRQGKIFLGINFGYRGFIMNDPLVVEEVAERISRKFFRICCVPLLEVETAEGEVKFALNDAYFNRIGGKSARMNLRVDETMVAERITGDGIVVSTALGSTGYALAAGGSAVYCGLHAISVVPIAVHTPIQIKPMVLPVGSKIEIEILNHSASEIKGWYDGIKLPSTQKVTIKSGMSWFLLAFWPDIDFTERLVRKIMKAGRG